MSGMGKMSMTFSQNGKIFGIGKNMKNVIPGLARQPHPQQQPQAQQQPQPQPHQVNIQSRGMVGGMPNRSAPKNVKQLFNLAHIMANPGTPCKACGS